MKLRHREEIEEALEEEGILQEECEWEEYHRRVRLGKCTCDLLEPFGHVTCPECNESFSF